MSNMLSKALNEVLEQKKALDEIPVINRQRMDEYIRKTYPQSINEMARVNTKEFYGLFPSNKFEIKIWSNDHNPPHFHVITDDGWDIVVLIDSGEIDHVKATGKSSKNYSYVDKHIEEWLKAKNASDNKFGNYILVDTRN